MHVLFTTDGSAAAEYAIAEGARLLAVDGARATVLTIDDVALTWPGPAAMVGAASMLEVRDPETLAADLERAAELLRGKFATVATVRREGDAATRILETAHDLAVDLIVVGTHGRGAVARLLLGSVSTAVLHGWPKGDKPGAVLVVRQPE